MSNAPARPASCPWQCRALLAPCSLSIALLTSGCGSAETTATVAPDASLPEDAALADAGHDADASVADGSFHEADAPSDEGASKQAWHAGTFRALPALSGDLVDTVAALDHPNAGGYGKLSSNRRQAFETLTAALFAAVEASLLDGDSGDWCGVLQLADAAGYELFRFYDTATGRWLVYGRDRTPYGQAYFFINPAAKRDLVIEAPHVPYDAKTDVEAARVFMGVAGRVLLLNKEHRCSDPDVTPCSGSSGPCAGDTYRESDVAHATDNSFHVLHRFLSDASTQTRLVQLHGMQGAADDVAEVSDGTNVDLDANSVSVTFVVNLRKRVPDPAALYSCQELAGWPPSQLCGATNVQGRYTNAPSADECTTPAKSGNGRFLHIEQRATLRDADDSDGYFWGDVRDALIDTFPECQLGASDTDCELGPKQDEPSDCTCGDGC